MQWAGGDGVLRRDDVGEPLREPGDLRLRDRGFGGASVPLSSLSLNVCYQGTAGAISALTDTDYLFNLSLPAGSLAPVTVAKAFSGLPPDAYTIGLCGCVTWDGVSLPAPDPATDWSWLTVQVFQQ